jgi:hypothetical protein
LSSKRAPLGTAGGFYLRIVVDVLSYAVKVEAYFVGFFHVSDITGKGLDRNMV